MDIALIDIYKTAVNEEEIAKHRVDSWQRELEMTQEWQDLQSAQAYLRDTKKVTEKTKNDLKWLALDHYENTKDKNPCKGIKIIENTSKRGPFETYVRKLIGTIFLHDFLQIEKVMSVKITLKDL